MSEIAEALELTALVPRKQPHRHGRFAARWLCLWLEEHEKATLKDLALLVSNLQSLATSEDHAAALATLMKVARQTDRRDGFQSLIGGDRRASLSRTGGGKMADKEQHQHDEEDE